MACVFAEADFKTVARWFWWLSLSHLRVLGFELSSFRFHYFTIFIYNTALNTQCQLTRHHKTSAVQSMLGEESSSFKNEFFI